MSAISKFINLCKMGGLKMAMRKAVLKVLGVSKQQEEIDALYYFLNSFFEPSQLGPTKDENLRIMQLCDADFLAVLDKVFEKHGLDYWLDCGTLLGAVRHKGFIPWDDDTDICMPRSDYERAIEILPQELNKYGITAKEDGDYPMHRIGVGYLHSKTGIWVDIFPMDEYYTDEPIEHREDDLKERIANYKNYYQKNHAKGIDVVRKKKLELIGKGEKNATKKLFYHCPEFCTAIRLYKPEQIYPLQRMPFEG